MYLIFCRSIPYSSVLGVSALVVSCTGAGSGAGVGSGVGVGSPCPSVCVPPEPSAEGEASGGGGGAAGEGAGGGPGSDGATAAGSLLVGLASVLSPAGALGCGKVG